jgi:hypothetical protein
MANLRISRPYATALSCSDHVPDLYDIAYEAATNLSTDTRANRESITWSDQITNRSIHI